MSTIDYNEFRKMQAQKRQRLNEKTGRKQNNNSGNESSGGSFEIPAWKLRMEYFRPTLQQLTKIRLLPRQNGELWYPFQSAWATTPRGKRQVISNSWHGERDVPCVLYHQCLETENPDLQSREQFAVSVVVLEDFYKIPKQSKKGNEYFIYERSLGVDKHGRSLDSAEHQGNDKVFGRKLHWSMSGAAHRNFTATLKGLTEKCASCDKGEISTYAFKCPECEAIMANHKDDPIDRETEQVLRSGDVVCPECEANVSAVEMYECVQQDGYKGEWSEGCGNPVRVSLTEPVDLVVKAVPAGKGTAIEVLEFAPADPSVKIPDWMMTGYNFGEFLGHMSLQEQADTMGVDMPFNPSDQALVDEFFTDDPVESVDPNDEDDDGIPF
jgi:hypothetical protein